MHNEPDLLHLKFLAGSASRKTKKVFAKLKKKPPKDLDFIIQNLHDREFKNINCLDCANCCKTTSPIWTSKDIARVAKYLQLKENDFIAQYLKLDPEGDYVLQDAPCPFLQLDNSCLIYEVRPKACAEYPHTNRRKFHQILSLTHKNTFVCPAVYNIIENLKAELGY